MKLPRIFCILCLSLGVLAQSASGQSLIVHQRPVHLRRLAGSVIDPSGSPIPGARIEIQSAADHRVLFSAISDSAGRFSFTNDAVPSPAELLVSHDLFQPVQYVVVLRWFAHGQLRIVLPLAV
jgi:hypothetical protein